MFHPRHLLTGIALALLASSAAQAQSTLLSTPWYVGAGVGGVLPESLRKLNPGPQGRVLVGIPLRPQAFVEFSGFGFTASGEGAAPKETTLGGGVDLKLESLGERFNFLFIAGGGYSQARRGGNTVNAPYANIGWGAELELTPALALRTELRGLARFGDDFIVNRGVTYDSMLTVGLTQRFGAVPKAAAPYVPPAPAPYVPPPMEAPLPPPVVAPKTDDNADLPLLDLDLSRCYPAPAGVKTADDGCLAVQRTGLPLSRLFAGDSARLADDSDDLLVPLVVSLRRDPSLKAEIVVHTDTLGMSSINLDLTLRMAQRIRDRLLKYGVPASQIVTEGVGESEPIANEIDEEGRAKNRRLEFNLSR